MKEKKCIFCDWEDTLKSEEDNYDWEPCDKCRIKCGLEKEAKEDER